MHQQSTFLFFLILHPLSLHRPMKQNGQACRIFDFLWKCFFIYWEPLASSSNALVLPKSGISLSPLCSGWPSPTVTSHSRSWLLRPACHRSPKEVFLISTCPQWLVLCGTSVFKPPFLTRDFASLFIHSLHPILQLTKLFSWITLNTFLCKKYWDCSVELELLELFIKVCVGLKHDGPLGEGDVYLRHKACQE